MTTYTPDVYNSSGTLANNMTSNSPSRKFQDPNRCDAAVFVKRFYYKNETGAALADGTIIDAGPILGPGFILPESSFSSSALGASRVLNVGLNTYKDLRDNSDVAGDINTIAEAVDVSSAVTEALFNVTSDSNPDGLELFGPARLLIQVTGGTIPTNAIIAGRLFISKPM